MSVVGIWSGKNVLKHAFSDSDTMDKPNTLSGLSYFSTKTILHDLGYVPLVRVYYDPDNDGKIFPCIGERSETSDSPLAGPGAVLGSGVAPFWLYVDDVTTTAFTLRTLWSSSLGGTFPFYYRVYRDPTL